MKLAIEDCNNPELLQQAIIELFTIIDDIDTASDMFHPDITPYVRYVMKKSHGRGSVVYSDGYGIFVNDISEVSRIPKDKEYMQGKQGTSGTSGKKLLKDKTYPDDIVELYKDNLNEMKVMLLRGTIERNKEVLDMMVCLQLDKNNV